MGMLALLLACLLLASPMSAAHAGDAKTASSSRDVWLKRAQSNADAFMTGMASWYGADFHNKKTSAPWCASPTKATAKASWSV